MKKQVYNKPKQNPFIPTADKIKPKNTARRKAAIILLFLFTFWTIVGSLGALSFFGVHAEESNGRIDSLPDEYVIDLPNYDYSNFSQLVNTYPYWANISPIYNGNYKAYISTDIPSVEQMYYTSGGVDYILNYPNNGSITVRKNTANTKGLIVLNDWVKLPAGTYFFGVYGFLNGSYSLDGINSFLTCNVEISDDGVVPDILYTQNGSGVGSYWFISFTTGAEYYVRLSLNNVLGIDTVKPIYYPYFCKIPSNHDFAELPAFTQPTVYGLSVSTFFNTYKLAFEQGYVSGYNFGYEQGTEKTYQEGFRDGQDLGFSQGFDEGYYRGLEDSGTNNFYSLLAAVVDAPIQALTGLLNFEFLGVNLWQFFTGLLTCTLVIAVIRLIL